MDNFLDVLGDFSFDEIDVSGELENFSSFNFDAYGDTSGGTEGDDYILNYSDEVKILALGGDDTIENVGSYVYIDGGTEGDQIINTDGVGLGSFVFINGGEGDDTIQNGTDNTDGGDNVTITGGAGNDYIENNHYHDESVSNSANALISGGEGDDTIINRNAPDATLIGSAGNDTIINTDGANVLFKYKSGDGNDLIQGFNETSTLQIGDGSGTYSTTTDGDDLIVTVGEDTITLEGAANLSTVNIAGSYVNPLLIVGTQSADNIRNTVEGATIQALGGNDYIYNNKASNVSINAGDGNDTVTNQSGGTVGLATSVAVNGGNGNDFIENWGGDNVSLAGEEGDDTLANYSGNEVLLSGGSGNDSLRNHVGDDVTISGGAGNDYIRSYIGNNISIDGGKGNDTISLGDSLTDILIQYTEGDGNDLIQGFNETSTLQIGGGTGTYSMSTSGNDLIVTVGEGSIILQGAASLSAVNISGEEISLTPEWTLSGTTATYGTANETLITVTGVKSVDGLSEPNDNNVVTIAKASVNAKNITISDGYTLALADDVTAPKTTNAWAFSGTTATYNQTTSAGYTLTNNKIIYSKKSTTPLVTVEGVTGKDGLTIDEENKIITVSTTSLGTNEVTISDGYTLALADDVNESETNPAGWTLDETTATYNGASKTEGYTLSSDGKSITYSAETTATSLATVKGATSTGGLTISGNTIKLAAGSLSSVVAVASDDYGFEFVSGYKSGKITGTGSDDTIKTAGQKVTVNAGKGDDVITVSGKYSSVVGGAGNDSIKNTGANVSINAGKGNDTIENTGDNVVFTYTSGDGNDLIRGYNETSTLQVSNSSFSTTKSGDDVIVSVDSAKITLEGAASLFPDNVPIWYMLDTDVAVFGTATETYLTVSGVKSSYGFEFDGTTVIIPSSCLNKKNVTITDGYKLAVDDDVKEPTTITEATWSLDGTTATYTSAATTEGYSVSSDGKTIIYNAAQEATDLFTVKGVKALTGLSLSGTVVTVAKASLTNKNVTISDGYTLKLASNVAAPSTIDAEWKLEDTTATYYGESTTKGYTLASDAKSIKYSKATAAAALASIEGATSTDGLTISGNTIKAAASGLSKNISVASDDYGFEFVSGYKSANINGSGEDDTIKAAGQKVTVGSGAGNDSIVATGKYASVDGGAGNDFITASGAGATLNGGKGNDTLTGGSGANVFVYANGDGKDVITNYNIEDRISIASGTETISTSGNDVIFTVGKGSITVKDAADKLITYYDAEGNELFYPKPEENVEYNSAGTSATLPSTYKADSFTPSDYADHSGTLKTIVASAVEHDLSIEGNKLANRIIGTDENDTIDGAAGKDTLIGGDGNDSLNGGTGNDSIAGGAGKDTLTGGAGSDIFVFNEGDGKDLITDYSEEQGDKIRINAAASSIKYEVGKTSIVFIFGTSDRITLKNAAEQAVTYVDAAGVETVINNKTVVYNDAGTSATLNAGYTADKFTPTEYADYSTTLKTIDASAVEHDLTITGNKLANKIIGSGQDDFINGANGADVLYGGAGADTLAGGSGNDKLYGEAGNDSLSGGAGADTLVGGKGKDTLVGGAGADLFVFNAGDGANLITDYSEEQGDKISINAAASSINYEVGKTNVVFTFGTSDRITVKNAAEQAVTYLDADGVEYLLGGKKPVEYNAAGTSATLNAGYPADEFTPTEYADYVSTLKTIDASAVEHDLTITGNKLANKITGSNQDDFIDGAAGADNITGGAGNDTLYGNSGNDKLFGEDGNDSLSGGKGADTLEGGAGKDTLIGGDGADLFIFNAGDGANVISDYSEEQGDKISINAAASSIKYEVGKTSVVFTFGTSDRITLKNAAEQAVTYLDAAGVETVINEIKSVVYNDAGTSATLTANYTDNAFTSKNYSDYATTLKTIDASAVEHDLKITGNKLANKITGSGQDDFIDGAGGADVIAGGEGADTLYGNSGNDKLFGDAGNDSLSGGAGADTLEGGAGKDTLVGGAGADLFVYNNGDGNDLISDYNGEDGDKIQIASGEVDTINISKTNVIFTVGKGKITVKDGVGQTITYIDANGNEKIGYGTNPVVYNEAGTSATLASYYLDDAFTPTEYADFSSTLKTIDASAVEHDLTITGNKLANKITGSSQDDTIDGAAGADKLYGGDGNDSLSGGNGNDYLSGGNGNDTLWGGAGSDTLVGGKGYDTFIYNDGDGNDVIEGYQDNIDKIILNSGKIDSVYDNGNDVIFQIGTGQITVKDASSQFVALYDSDDNMIRPYHNAKK